MVEIALFGIGFGLSADARLEAGVFDPFHLLRRYASASCCRGRCPTSRSESPWSGARRTSAAASRSAQGDRGRALQVHRRLASSAAAACCFPTTTPATDFWLPIRWRRPDEDAPAPADAPVVPLDSRPHLTFGRAVHDDALVGTTPQPPHPSADPPGWERIGDPAANEGPMRVRFGLREVSIERWADGPGRPRRSPARRSTRTPRACPSCTAPGRRFRPALGRGGRRHGSPDRPGQALAVVEDAVRPFQPRGAAWDEWFTDRFVRYPCLPPAPDQVVCCDFGHLQPGELSSLTSTCVEHPEIVFASTGAVTVESVFGGRVLCWHDAAPTDVVLTVGSARRRRARSST